MLALALVIAAGILIAVAVMRSFRPLAILFLLGFSVVVLGGYLGH